MRTTLVVAVVALLFFLPSPSRAEEPDLGRMEEQIKQLEQIVEGLLRRIASLEAALTGSASAPAGAEPSAQPSRPPSEETSTPAVSPDVKELYDRFTGLRGIYAESGPIMAAHKDDPSESLALRLTWEIEHEDGKLPVYRLYLETSSKIRQWPKGTLVHFLEDGRRSRVEVEGEIMQSGSEYIEVAVVLFRKEAAVRFAKARKVEVRAGNWEFVIPTAFRALATQVNERLEQPPSGR